MKKKVVVIGGGTGMSTLLRGLKEFPIDITAIVSVCDDGRSTGLLRKEFNVPAVGDVRQVMLALSNNEDTLNSIFNYRFKKNSTLNGHALGNLLLTATTDMNGSISKGLESLSSILNLKGSVIPLSDSSDITLVAKMKDGTIIEGEHNITESNNQIDYVYYKKEPKVQEEAINAIIEADLIVLSMGSIYTSIVPNLIPVDIKNSIDSSKAQVLYVCNMMTQPGETDDFKVSDHITELNKYLGNKKVSIVLVNNQKIDPKIASKYETLEQKQPVLLDEKNLKNIKLIQDNFFIIKDNVIRHNAIKVGFHIFSLLI